MEPIIREENKIYAVGYSYEADWRKLCRVKDRAAADKSAYLSAMQDRVLARANSPIWLSSPGSSEPGDYLRISGSFSKNIQFSIWHYPRNCVIILCCKKAAYLE